MSLLRSRVAITRDEERDGPLAQALRNVGLEPVGCRAVLTAPPQDPRPLVEAARRLERYQWLIVASVRAVRAIAEPRGGAPLPEALWTAAVGDGTARALRFAGARSVLVGQGGGARGLLAALVKADAWIGRRVLVPRAEHGDRWLASALWALGAKVDEVVAYRTVDCPADEIVRRWRRSAPDAVVVTSPSAARALANAIDLKTLRSLAAVVAIGPTTARALNELGIDAVVSERTDFISLAERTRQALDCAAITRCTSRTPRHTAPVIPAAGGPVSRHVPKGDSR